MTTITAPGARRIRPRGIDRVLYTAGLWLVRVSEARAARAAVRIQNETVTHEERARLLRTEREVDSMRIVADVRLGAR